TTNENTDILSFGSAEPSILKPFTFLKLDKEYRVSSCSRRQSVLRSSDSRNPIAAARPTAPATFGVPASNFNAPVAKYARIDSISTYGDILIPAWNGGIASRSSLRAQRAPMPIGPHILCPEKARKSQPRSCTSTWR